MKDLFKKLEKNKEIETIMQFGSSLKKKDYSDIDICIFTKEKLPLKEKLLITSLFSQKYDICFFDDLPLHIKKRVLSEGKIIFTKNYYKILEQMKVIDYEYPFYKKFLEEYHNKRIVDING